MAAAADLVETTTINDSNMVTVPARIRDRLDIGPGDEVKWKVDDEGQLLVEVVRHEYGAFDDFTPVGMGGDGTGTHDVAGHHRSGREDGS